jgi:hypothetical protein
MPAACPRAADGTIRKNTNAAEPHRAVALGNAPRDHLAGVAAE